MDKHEINFKLDPESASVLGLALAFYIAEVRKLLEVKTLVYHEEHRDWYKRLRQMQSDLRAAITQAHREGGTS